MRAARRRHRVLLFGSLPPPTMGPSLATEVLLRSSLRSEFELIHFDTSDHRLLSTLGAVDLANIYLAIRSYLLLPLVLLRYRPDLVYIPISQTTLGYLRDSVHVLMAKALCRSVICHLRGGNFRNWLLSASSLTRWYVGFVHRRVAGQIVLGDCLRDQFSELLPQDRIFTVPNGKDCDFAPRREASAGPMRVLYLSNLVRSKGILEALHAVAAAAAKGAALEFDFGGAWVEDETRREVMSFLEEHPSLDIRSLGIVDEDEKRRAFEEADVFLLPTYYAAEGHPWVLVEAMAAGLAIVTTDQGAIRESVIDGVNGFIVPKRSYAEAAERLGLLAEGPDLRAAMGRESRRLYLEGFTEARMAENMASVFRSILASE